MESDGKPWYNEASEEPVVMNLTGRLLMILSVSRRTDAPMLCGKTDQFDKITKRKAESCAITQMSFFEESTGGQMR